MTHQDMIRLAVAAGPAASAGAVAAAADRPTIDRAAVDAAFTALRTYDWGADRNTLNPIDQAVVEKDGKKVVVGKTATLELKPNQAETLALAESISTCRELPSRRISSWISFARFLRVIM